MAKVHEYSISCQVSYPYMLTDNFSTNKLLKVILEQTHSSHKLKPLVIIGK